MRTKMYIYFNVRQIHKKCFMMGISTDQSKIVSLIIILDIVFCCFLFIPTIVKNISVFLEWNSGVYSK